MKRTIIFSKFEGQYHRTATVQENDTIYLMFQDAKTFKTQGVAFSIEELEEITRRGRAEKGNNKSICIYNIITQDVEPVRILVMTCFLPNSSVHLAHGFDKACSSGIAPEGEHFTEFAKRRCPMSNRSVYCRAKSNLRVLCVAFPCVALGLVGSPAFGQPSVQGEWNPPIGGKSKACQRRHHLVH